MQRSFYWEANSPSACQENLLPIMEPETLLMCLHEPTSGPPPEPDKSSPEPRTFFL
jgi:hypothetical protein